MRVHENFLLEKETVEECDDGVGCEALENTPEREINVENRLVQW